MTFKQLMIRYLKENGFYSTFAKANRRQYYKLINENDMVQFFEYVRANVWRFKYNTIYEFLSRITKNKMVIKAGDIIEVKTQDGKYTFKYIVFDVWYTDFSVLMDNGGRISLSRVISVNGEPYDFNNGWEFKNKLAL